MAAIERFSSANRQLEYVLRPGLIKTSIRSCTESGPFPCSSRKQANAQRAGARWCTSVKSIAVGWLSNHVLRPLDGNHAVGCDIRHDWSGSCQRSRLNVVCLWNKRNKIENQTQSNSVDGQNVSTNNCESSRSAHFLWRERK
jgi:hypothetical protein